MQWLINKSGGLNYHLRAIRFQSNIWSPFKDHLNNWLKEWQPSEKKLVLIGASGGYTIPKQFLDQFDHVFCIDPDPMAQPIFKHRFQSQNIYWDSDDYLETRSKFKLSLEDLVFRYHDSAFLFCNVLGQRPLLLESSLRDEAKICKWNLRLTEKLKKTTWASFHDRLSIKAQPFYYDPISKPFSLTVPELLDHYFPHSQSGEVIDHLSQQIGINLPKWYCPWQLTPQHCHIIEGVFNSRST
jgi:hypothetical protein